MAMHETTGAKWVRGLVKTIFIACYVAFMWASIHHVATYFTDFEQNSGNTAGSYALAGAFDITALVTTIGVMFFRKSMPTWVVVIVWAFILAIAAYSFVINWEYASHYQNLDLIMQPTGATTPVYDLHGVVHYVPVMQANTSLIWINPILASGFTIFSLVYSVIAEFFGTKLPTAEELLARKQYLEETGSLLEEIKQLEDKSKKPSLIQRTKAVAKEVKEAANELLSTPNDAADRLANGTDLAGGTEAQGEQEMEPGTADVHDDVGDDPQVVTEPVTALSLGFIEEAMYRQLQGHPPLLQELLTMAETTDIPGLTTYLQRRFASHATSITTERVARVLAVVQAEQQEARTMDPMPETLESANVAATGNDRNAAMEEKMEATAEVPTEDQHRVADEADGNETQVSMEDPRPIAGSQQGTETEVAAEHAWTNGLPSDEPTTTPEIETTNVSPFPSKERQMQEIHLTHRRKPLTVSEAAAVLKVSEKTVRALRKNGKLIANAEGLITVASLRKALESRKSA